MRDITDLKMLTCELNLASRRKRLLPRPLTRRHNDIHGQRRVPAQTLREDSGSSLVMCDTEPSYQNMLNVVCLGLSSLIYRAGKHPPCQPSVGVKIKYTD